MSRQVPSTLTSRQDFVESTASRRCERPGDLREEFNHHRRDKPVSVFKIAAFVGICQSLKRPVTHSYLPAGTASPLRTIRPRTTPWPARDIPTAATAAAWSESGPPGACDHPVDHIGWEGPRQDTQRYVITQKFRGFGLNPSAASHTYASINGMGAK